jgi:hypothetical protein
MAKARDPNAPKRVVPARPYYIAYDPAAVVEHDGDLQAAGVLGTFRRAEEVMKLMAENPGTKYFRGLVK